MRILPLLLLFLVTHFSYAQLANGYALSLEPINIQGFTGAQSFAIGQANGKWLLVGGRTDGLHQRQPFASFLASANNTQLIVIDPATQQSWSLPLSSLPNALQEQLQSTNMQFIQRENMLYIMGGYGFSATANDHVTFEQLTAIQVDSLIEAIQIGGNITHYFRQITNPIVGLSGGQIGRIGDDFYLVGGHKFMGRYNPQGPTHGPGFVQNYSNQIRKFQIQDDGNTLTINNINLTTDSINLHRRDYNMLPQIFSGNVQGFTAFSGVFQPLVNLPYLNTIDIFQNSHSVNNTFTQYLNHYHCAKAVLYDSVNLLTENIFFGGISQYFIENGVLTQDDNAPFTKAITKVSRDANGNMSETQLAEMPDWLGAGAEFVPNPTLQHYENEILKSATFTGDSVLLGYVVGGILSSAKNIFFVNTGTQSTSNSTIYKVWLTQNTNALSPAIPQHSIISQLQISPNPSHGKFQLNYWNAAPITFTLTVYDSQGKLVTQKKITNQSAGKQAETLNLHANRGTYLLSIHTENEQINRTIFIE